MAHKENSLIGILSMPQAPSGDYQEKCIIPSDEEQVVTADSGHASCGPFPGDGSCHPVELWQNQL